MGCLHNQLLCSVSQKNSCYRLSRHLLSYPLLGSSHTSTLSLTSEQHFFTSVWKPEKLQWVWQDMKENCSTHCIYIGFVCWGFFCFGFVLLVFHLPTLQATSRDENIDPRQISPSRPSFGMRRLSLRSTNTKGITYITHPWHQIPPRSIRTTALRVGWHLSKVRLGEVNKNPKRTILGQLVVLLTLQEDFSCFL